MTKRKTIPTTETVDVPTDEISSDPETNAPEIETKVEEQPAAQTPTEKPKYNVKDRVWVRVNVDHGMLAGTAVYRGERHEVMFYQFKEAQQRNPDGYALIT